MGFHGWAAAHKPKITKHDNAPVHKARSIQKGLSRSVWRNLTGVHRALTTKPLSTFEIIWNADWEPGLIAQHQCPTSLMLLWLSRSKSPKQCSSAKPSQKSGGCYCSKRGANFILTPMILEWVVWQAGVHIPLVMCAFVRSPSEVRS
jgi:hypothetical protein